MTLTIHPATTRPAATCPGPHPQLPTVSPPPPGPPTCRHCAPLTTPPPTPRAPSRNVVTARVPPPPPSTPHTTTEPPYVRPPPSKRPQTPPPPTPHTFSPTPPLRTRGGPEPSLCPFFTVDAGRWSYTLLAARPSERPPPLLRYSLALWVPTGAPPTPGPNLPDMGLRRVLQPEHITAPTVPPPTVSPYPPPYATLVHYCTPHPVIARVPANFTPPHTCGTLGADPCFH
ncbi:hypothetical protein CesoFtcFv8_000203 [Champsocephalus esox]|uniref:Uncharacterized protein n=1 Tax=Champsocephalus esox TaxID=159716 RepID=A0AAN8DYK3_9TELE|nr:hypothetical protein CesoFtcFv8_000203 [Champsocephalus esox]